MSHNNLDDRLEQLENEIHMLLAIQQRVNLEKTIKVRHSDISAVRKDDRARHVAIQCRDDVNITSIFGSQNNLHSMTLSQSAIPSTGYINHVQEHFVDPQQGLEGTREECKMYCPEHGYNCLSCEMEHQVRTSRSDRSHSRSSAKKKNRGQLYRAHSISPEKFTTPPQNEENLSYSYTKNKHLFDKEGKESVHTVTNFTNGFPTEEMHLRKATLSEISLENHEACKRVCEAQQKLKEEMKNLTEALQMIEVLRKEIADMKAKCECITTSKEMLEQELRKFKRKYKGAKTAHKKARKKNDKLQCANMELCRKFDEETSCQLEKVKQTESQCQILQRAHQELTRQNNEASDKLELQNNNIIVLNKKISKQNCDLLRLKKENEVLIEELHQEKDRNGAYIIKVNTLENRLQEVICVEMDHKREILNMRTQIKQMEHSHEKKINSVAHKELEAMRLESIELQNQLKDISKRETDKCERIQDELRHLTKIMYEKEQILIAERDELNFLVEELCKLVATHKIRIFQLTDINKQQEVLLYSQNSLLHSQDEQVKLAETETSAFRQQTSELEVQIELLRKSLMDFEDMKNNYDALMYEHANCNCKKSPEEAQTQNLLIKDKIIEDQSNKIKNFQLELCQKGNLIESIRMELLKFQKQLNLEKQTKHELMNKIKMLEWQRDSMRKQMVEMKFKTQQKSNQCDKNDKIEHQQRLLQSLEQQVALKQKEWELQCQVLTKEKEHAMQVAKFATQKLLEAFQDSPSRRGSLEKIDDLLTHMMEKKKKESRKIRFSL